MNQTRQGHTPTSPCSGYLGVSEKVLMIWARLQSSNLSSEFMKHVWAMVVMLLHVTRAILRYAPTDKLMSQSQRVGGIIGHTKHTLPLVSPFVYPPSVVKKSSVSMSGCISPPGVEPGAWCIANRLQWTATISVLGLSGTVGVPCDFLLLVVRLKGLRAKRDGEWRRVWAGIRKLFCMDHMSSTHPTILECVNWMGIYAWPRQVHTVSDSGVLPAEDPCPDICKGLSRSQWFSMPVIVRC